MSFGAVPIFAKQKIYDAVPFENGWVVEVGRGVTNAATGYAGVVQAMQPYELLLDAAGRVVQIRERTYPYTGPASNYGDILRTVHTREEQRDGGAHFSAQAEKEMAAAEAKEKAAKAAKAAPKK
jgi:hypothetical protein